MQAVQRPVQMDIESPSHIPGPINGNPYATVNQAMKMKCRAAEEEGSRDADYPGEKKVAKYNGDNLVFQFPVVLGEKQLREENRKEAMNELLGSLGVDPSSLKSVSMNEKEMTVTISSSQNTKNPKPPQRQSSFKATKKFSTKTSKTTGQQHAKPAKSPQLEHFEVPMVQTAPHGEHNVYYASHYAASQPGKVKAKLHIDSNSSGQVSPTASPELIANRKLLLDVIEGGEESEDDLETMDLGSDQVQEPVEENSDSESEEDITFHESPTLPRRGNVAAKVEFLSKSMAFSPPADNSDTTKCKNTTVPLIGLTHLAPTEVSDRIAKHNEKSLAPGQVMGTENMVLYSSKQPPKKVLEYNPDRHVNEDEEAEDFRTASVLRHHQEGWNKVETNESDTSDVHSDHAEEDRFPPPPPLTPPPTPPVVKTVHLGEQAEFRLNIKVSDIKTNVPSPTSSDGHVDSGCEDSSASILLSPHGPEVAEPTIQKLTVQQEESVSEDLLNELFSNADESLPQVAPVKTQERPQKEQVKVVITRQDSEERRFAEEDEAAGYSRIEDIKPGKGQEDAGVSVVKENGMTDEEFLNSYKIIPGRKEADESVEPAKRCLQQNEQKSLGNIKQKAEERKPAVLNELINGIRTMKQEMSYKAREQTDLESEIFPTSPRSDKSSPTAPLSPTSTLSSRGKRRHRKASDKGYSSTNSSLSESELFVEIPKNPSVKFDKDTSAYWYKPHITREQAIALLQDKPPGTFVIRDSQSYTGAFGLAVKVEVPPMHVIQNQTKDFSNIDPSEFVRHLLIESTPKGVHLKDCKDEPLFGSLAAFVYQHSITEISLPCKLMLPTKDLTVGTLKITDRQETETQLLAQGAACNVAYLGSFNVESLTGPAALQYAVAKIEPGRKNKEQEPVLVNFKVNRQGITLTDNERKLFFRKHYPLKSILYWGTDPDDTRWDLTEHGGGNMARSFVFVSRKPDSDGNECHLFGEMDPKQPASTVVDVITKIISNVSP